jgi:VWFA-related protein
MAARRQDTNPAVGSNLLKLLIAFCLIALPVARVQSQTPRRQDDDVIRTETDLTNLLFIATDKNNRYITTLQEADIRVLEDSVQQTLFTFQRETDRPLSIAFLIDVSTSQRRTLPQEKSAARSFIESVIRSNKDLVAIIPFEGFAHLEQPLTHDILGVYRALASVEVAEPSYLGSGPIIGGIVSRPGGIGTPDEGMTSIWDAVSVSSREVLARSTGQRRRAIILLTDGQDTSSRLSRNDAINYAIQSETVVYVVGIGDSKAGGVDKDGLKKMAEQTGGRAFFPKKETDLKTAFGEIEQELRSQYLVAYSSTNKKRDGAFRKMAIEITNPELRKEQLKLRYRPGYFARRVS